MVEQWKTCHYPGYDIYEVSNKGRVRRKKYTRETKVGNRFKVYTKLVTYPQILLKPRTNRIAKAIFVDMKIWDEHGNYNGRKSGYVALMVMEAFGKPRTSVDQKVLVIDGNHNNCHIDNLKWEYQSYFSRQNMINYPENRNNLKEANIASGYYESLKTKKDEKDL